MGIQPTSDDEPKAGEKVSVNESRGATPSAIPSSGSLPASWAVPITTLIANFMIILGYSLIFGWRWVGLLYGNYEAPEHWEGAGGVVGAFGMTVRGIVILVLSIPFAFLSVTGIVTGIKAFASGQRRVLAGLLLIAHGVMALPALAIIALLIL